MTPSRPRSEASSADARRAAATRTTATGLVSAAVALLLVGSGLLWTTVAGVVAAAAGLGLGVAGLVRSRGTARRGLVVASAVAAIVLGTAGLLTGGARLALWPVATAYEQCVSSTVTLSGAARCQEQLQEEIWRYLSGGAGAPGDAAGSPSGSAPTGPASRGPAPG